VIAIGMVATAAARGIRAHVTDRFPWTMLAAGTGAIWLAVTLVAVFAPVWVTGTDPTQLPVWAGLAAITGVILTGILCNLVKTGSFEPAASTASSPVPTPAQGAGPTVDDATVTLQRLAQLRNSGAITDAEFEAKKQELLSRI